MLCFVLSQVLKRGPAFWWLSSRLLSRPWKPAAQAFCDITSQSTTGPRTELPCFFSRCQNYRGHPSIFVAHPTKRTPRTRPSFCNHRAMQKAWRIDRLQVRERQTPVGDLSRSVCKARRSAIRWQWRSAHPRDPGLRALSHRRS